MSDLKSEVNYELLKDLIGQWRVIEVPVVGVRNFMIEGLETSHNIVLLKHTTYSGWYKLDEIKVYGEMTK